MSIELGINQVAQRIHQRLQRYIEAQYHIRNDGLIKEREELLTERGGISRVPFLEATPSYQVGGGFAALKIPEIVGGLLDELTQLDRSIGVFPPYQHQALALETFFEDGDDGRDLIVATGTGSGKTETFLYPILGALALEGSQRAAAFAKPGVRALLLYPMNALVSDQTARLRRLLGDPQLSDLFASRWGRRPRFGMYTSRTPYPGVRDRDKDARHLQPIFEHYERLEASADDRVVALVKNLKELGRWPSKDVVAFFAKHLEEQVPYSPTSSKAGTSFVKRHWSERFLTQPADRELVTRDEIQTAAPDLLITNYSMLEYMLLRPIERSIFSQTRDWLNADKHNRLILVLDEAHMYRGVGGAEVGLLIRRLIARLRVNRDRVRCILTSASISKGQGADKLARDFGRALTGERATKPFFVIRGTLEQRQGAREGSSTEAQALARVPAAVLAAAALAPVEAMNALHALAVELSWPQPPNLVTDALKARQHIASCLTGFGPFELLVREVSGNATSFSSLAKSLFPGAAETVAEGATDALFALGSFARRTEKGRAEQPLMPARVHLLFRGLPSLYACINPSCSQRRHAPGQVLLLGRLYTSPRGNCPCGGRVFELLTHRDCGAALLRAYGLSARASFLWDQRGGTMTNFGKPLHELHLLVEDPHPKMQDAVEPVDLDIRTGRVSREGAGGDGGSIRCYRPASPEPGEISTFDDCPVCMRETQKNGPLKIMDLATKGEQPFANLVREQFVCQVPTAEADDEHPNEGRKALLFSDGRQKAARLARDLPREVERDSFREALVLAVKELEGLRNARQVTLKHNLYAAFVAVCARFRLYFFDRSDQKALLAECRRFTKDWGTLEAAFDEDWQPSPSIRYRQALLRQISDPHYSLVAACAAVVEPRAARLRALERRLAGRVQPDALRDIAECWIGEMLRRNAFDPDLTRTNRLREFPYFRPVTTEDGLKRFFKELGVRAGLDSSVIAAVRQDLFDVFTKDGADGDTSGRLLVPEDLTLKLTLHETWKQCALCGNVQARPIFGRCANTKCGAFALEDRRPDHAYLAARKGFFREPLIAVLGGARPLHITAEEHTAQLSQRDAGVVYATTEEFELRFRDVPLGDDKPPVDVLSCTTTMEVGIDIGSLTAVGLRTVPPQRENYQQRAGRAGRRGTALSTVLTFAQGGSHDAHYFANPELMISGPPRDPRIKSDNRRLARRHINSHLLQTFFHSAIERLSPEEQAKLRKTRPGIMSAFGDAIAFFTEGGEFSYLVLDRWMDHTVLAPTSSVISEIASWLPVELETEAEQGTAGREAFAREVAEELRAKLRVVQRRVLDPTHALGAQAAISADDESGTLLELLFDEGVLPSYAFPTDLCSFFIQRPAEYGKVSIKERPQLSKSQALSEYAPGRLLVVNKETYRVGGIFAGGPPTSMPAAPLFTNPLRSYVGCSHCTYLRLESEASQTQATPDELCPVCLVTPLSTHQFLDPPGFSPEEGQAINENDREQELTYASTAQMPELPDRGKFALRSGPGLHISHAYGVEIPLVVTNKGKDENGFAICESCGAAWLTGDEKNPHPRPFLLPEAIRRKESAARLCSGTIRPGVVLGHEFKTDVLLLRLTFRAPMDFDLTQPWLTDAMATLAEAVALGASIRLDIDPGELSAGFRFLPSFGDEAGSGEVYLFDTASGGAGYSAEAGECLDEILEDVELLLDQCPGNCQRSCTKCLRHYGNRFLHGRLDRRLALAALRFCRRGTEPAIAPAEVQRANLGALSRYLELEGWNVAAASASAAPLEATSPEGKHIFVGLYPALLEHSVALATHPVSTAGPGARLLPDYLVQHDLPSAYRALEPRQENRHG